MENQTLPPIPTVPPISPVIPHDSSRRTMVGVVMGLILGILIGGGIMYYVAIANNPTQIISVPVPIPTPVSTEPTQTPTNPTTPTTPVASDEFASWERKTFSMWTLDVPPDWTANINGLSEGYLGFNGNWNGHTYQLDLQFPKGIDTYAVSVDNWVEHEGSALKPPSATAYWTVLTADRDGYEIREMLGIHNAASGDTQHNIFIWKKGSTNQRLITLTLDKTVTLEEAQKVAERVLKGIQL